MQIIVRLMVWVSSPQRFIRKLCFSFKRGATFNTLSPQDNDVLFQNRNNSRQEIPAKAKEFQAYLEAENGERIPIDLAENSDGTIAASYILKDPGFYKGFVLLSEYPSKEMNSCSL
jgi:hypothetical protein